MWDAYLDLYLESTLPVGTFFKGEILKMLLVDSKKSNIACTKKIENHLSKNNFVCIPLLINGNHFVAVLLELKNEVVEVVLVDSLTSNYAEVAKIFANLTRLGKFNYKAPRYILAVQQDDDFSCGYRVVHMLESVCFCRKSLFDCSVQDFVNLSKNFDLEFYRLKVGTNLVTHVRIVSIPKKKKKIK
jgi:hypothetical protein